MRFNPSAVAVLLAFWLVFALALHGVWIANAGVELFLWGGLIVASVLAVVHWARTGVFAPYRERMWRWFFDENDRH